MVAFAFWKGCAVMESVFRLTKCPERDLLLLLIFLFLRLVAMRRNRTIQIKAIFLLIVFALNTMVGFACAVGLEMEFNTKHHHVDSAVPVATKTHHHDNTDHHHHPKEKKNPAEDDNCCNDNVIKFSQLDKLLAHAVNAGIEIPVMLVHLHFLYNTYLSSFTTDYEQIPVARPYISSSRGIRVSIQSFQI